MLPIVFEQSRLIRKTPEEICSEIADVARWKEFEGYLFLPGIKTAEYETRTRKMTGSRIRVRNRDGSAHTEEIRVWNPAEKVVIKLYDFSSPLNRLSTHFIEEWQFKADGGATLVTRKFELFAKNFLARSFLWLISFPLRKAVARHLDKISRE